jgi:hypothetical protein
MARLRSPAGRILVVVLCAGLAVGVAGAAQRVQPKRPVPPSSAFMIGAANLRHALRPGTSQSLDLRLTNPHHHSLAITGLTATVVVDRAHARAGCDARRDFRWVDAPAASYPVRLRARRTRSLRQLGMRVLPRVAMVAVPRNQDACKGARLGLELGGGARRWSAGRRR